MLKNSLKWQNWTILFSKSVDKKTFYLFQWTENSVTGPNSNSLSTSVKPVQVVFPMFTSVERESIYNAVEKGKECFLNITLIDSHRRRLILERKHCVSHQEETSPLMADSSTYGPLPPRLKTSFSRPEDVRSQGRPLHFFCMLYHSQRLFKRFLITQWISRRLFKPEISS